MYKIELKEMEFFAFHGCMAEEQKIGGNYIVNLSVCGDFSKAALSDNIDDALNYISLYNIVKREMEIPSHLIENVAKRILDSVQNKFPDIASATVTIIKKNPPVGGRLYGSSVTLSYP